MIISNQTDGISNYYSDQLMSFNPDSYGLLFNKPVFDMAFILTHENLTLNISKFQKHFQSKLRFTTHCILIEDASKIGVCLRDLKTQNISYAIILREHSETLNSYDLYVLHRNEVQTNITIEKLDFLVCNDFNTLMNQIKLVRKNPLKCPHLPPNDEKFVNMDDEIRYYFCLLFDNRVLTKNELEQVNRYLLMRKMKLENKTISGFQPIDETPDIIRPSKFVFKGPNNVGLIMPITSINDQPTTTNFTTYKADMEIAKPVSIIKDRKKSKFGPIVNPAMIGGKDNVVIEKPAIRYSDGKDNTEKSKSSSKKSSNRRSDSKRSSKHDSKRSRIDSGSRSRTSSRRTHESSPSHRNHDTKHSADESRSSGSSRKPQTESSASGRGGTTSDSKLSKSSKIKFSFIKSKAQSSSKTPSKKSRSPNKQHPRTEIVIKFPDGKVLPGPPPSGLWPNATPQDPEVKQAVAPVEQSLGDTDFIDLTDDFDENTSAITADFRKGPVIDIDIQTAKFLRPHDNLNSVRDFIHTIPPANQSSPDSLLNLFRLVLNLVPLGLPNDNVVYKILSNSCLVIQNGIKEPALKNVKINYTTCKTNGLTEVIANIYSIYNESQKDVNDTSYMAFIWNAYFPDHVSSFNLIILFYRFVKLLMLYTIFNKANVTKRLVWNVIEQVDVVVSFDFYCQTSSYNQGHLSCFSKTFDKYFKEHDQLHVLYSKLPNPNALPLTDKRKKLDSVIKKKKISFTIGPLLNYFVNSVNCIHRKMQPIQIEIIYGAVRTLRFCLRKINPQLVHTTFNNPKTFNFDFGKSTNHDNEILRELKILLGEIKSYQCVLFTEMHYEFINCLLDFAWMVEGTIDTNSDAFKATTRADTLIYLDPDQFVDGFASYENPISLLYHPDSELEHLKNSLKKHWTDILHQAFMGTQPEPCGWRMVKEMGILLPNSWGEIIFNEAVSEASRLYYAEYTRLGNNASAANCKSYSQSKSSGIEWLTKYRLPTANLNALRKYQQTLDKELLLRKP